MDNKLYQNLLKVNEDIFKGANKEEIARRAAEYVQPKEELLQELREECSGAILDWMASNTTRLTKLTQKEFREDVLLPVVDFVIDTEFNSDDPVFQEA